MIRDAAMQNGRNKKLLSPIGSPAMLGAIATRKLIPRGTENPFLLPGVVMVLNMEKAFSLVLRQYKPVGLSWVLSFI